MTPDELRSMGDELVKVGAPIGGITRAARWLTESPLRGAAVGSALGATAGASKERRQGGSGVRGAIRGAVLGGAVGGAAAGTGRVYRDVRLLDPSMSAGKAVGATARRMGGAVKQFGQRQLHGFTGAYGKDPGKIGLRSTATSQKKIHLERARLADRLQGAKTPEAAQKLTAKFKGREADLIREGKMGDRALKAGVTSMPGIAKGLVRDPRGTAKAMWKETTGGSRLGAGLAVGVPLAVGIPDLAKGDESAQGGRTVGQKLVGLGTSTLGGIATAGLPIVPQLAAASGIDYLGQKATRSKKQPE